MDTLTRTGIVIPAADGSDPTTAYRLSQRSIGTKMETSGALYGQGALADRPTAGTAGRLYKPSDAGLQGVSYWDDGTQWVTQGGMDLPIWATPGSDVPGLTGVAFAVTGTTTILAGPSSGRRVIKSLTIAGPAGGTLSLALAGVTLAKFSFTSQATGHELPVTIPIATSESLTATATGGTCGVLASYGERTDAAVSRLGLIAPSGSVSLVAAAGAARVVNQIWIGNPGASTVAASVTFAGAPILAAVPILAGRLLTLDVPRGLPAGQSVTVSGSGLTFMASGH